MTADAGVRLARLAALDFSDLRVKPDWCDRSGFMRTAYVTVLVDQAMVRAARDIWEIGWDHARLTGQSGFVVATKVTCLRSFRAGDPVDFEFVLADIDDKRLHAITTLRHGGEGWVGATQEQLNVCVDFKTRRTAPWHASARPRLEAMVAAQRSRHPAPHIGRAVGEFGQDA